MSLFLTFFFINSTNTLNRSSSILLFHILLSQWVYMFKSKAKSRVYKILFFIFTDDKSVVVQNSTFGHFYFILKVCLFINATWEFSFRLVYLFCHRLLQISRKPESNDQRLGLFLCFLGFIVPLENIFTHMETDQRIGGSCK